MCVCVCVSEYIALSDISSIVYTNINDRRFACFHENVYFSSRFNFSLNNLLQFLMTRTHPGQ